MKTKHTVFAALALTTASISGAATARAQNATLDAARRGEPIAYQYVETYDRLSGDRDVRLSFTEAGDQLRAAGVRGPTAAQNAEELAALNKLERAALPLVKSWIADTPAAQLPVEEVNRAFDLLAKMDGLHARNLTALVMEARAKGQQNAVTILAFADDAFQGGSMAGFAANEGSVLAKRNAVLDYFTGQQAKETLQQAGYDLRLGGTNRRLKIDKEDRSITAPLYALIQPINQQLTGYALRDWAAELVTTANPKPKGGYLINPVEGPYGNLLRARRGVRQNELAIDFSVSHARDVFLPAVAARLAALPPEAAPVKTHNARGHKSGVTGSARSRMVPTTPQAGRGITQSTTVYKPLKPL